MSSTGVGVIVSGKFVKLFSSFAALALVAGCSSSDMSGTFNFNKKKDETAADASKPVVVQGQCPLVYLREGTAVYRQYAKGAKKNPDGTSDPEKLVMQATLDQTTRQCFQGASGLRVTVVVHGRLILGPAGQPGTTYTLPIRVAATDGDATLYSELSQFPVTLAPGQSSGQFLFTKENVVLDPGGPASMARLFAGIDEGPYNTK
ncbi:MAG: hypothetical protein JWM58_1316 [Rhizobium sp.]|nr:hypothetical protein [Rhizobium sp.]